MKRNRISQQRIWAEMARRKIQFHPKENWESIRLWGLFSWGSIQGEIEKGNLINDGYTKENRILWVYPSKQAYETKILPLLNKPLNELTKLAGR